ncbi:hypothetical protein C8J57DRAFT_1521770 [Mycena rebaudengoi]|nr:hypothetical protein C8J57DRAFT_1521770 [Mycena rebaudengoi]
MKGRVDGVVRAHGERAVGAPSCRPSCAQRPRTQGRVPRLLGAVVVPGNLELVPTYCTAFCVGEAFKVRDFAVLRRREQFLSLLADTASPFSLGKGRLRGGDTPLLDFKKRLCVPKAVKSVVAIARNNKKDSEGLTSRVYSADCEPGKTVVAETFDNSNGLCARRYASWALSRVLPTASISPNAPFRAPRRPRGTGAEDRGGGNWAEESVA